MWKKKSWMLTKPSIQMQVFQKSTLFQEQFFSVLKNSFGKWQHNMLAPVRGPIWDDQKCDNIKYATNGEKTPPLRSRFCRFCEITYNAGRNGMESSFSLFTWILQLVEYSFLLHHELFDCLFIRANPSQMNEWREKKKCHSKTSKKQINELVSILPFYRHM